MDRAKITQAIRKAIADRDARSPAERQKIYAAARTALGKQLNGASSAATAIEVAISAIEASYAPKPQIGAIAPAATPGTGRSLQLFGAGVVLGAFVVALSIWAIIPAAPGGGKPAVALEHQYNNALPQIPIAVEFLRKVSDAVISMQKTDRAGLEAKASKNFIALQVLDPALVKQMPPSLPVGSAVIVRANAFDFKILFNWTLCGAVRITNPEMVDHVRSKADVVGCPYFGLWTPAAANW
jgi:hypothetical protein